MHARSLSVLSLVLAVPIAGVPRAQAQDTRPGIAVLPFDYSGSYGQNAEDFAALQQGLAGMLISELAANPSARVVERSTINRILEEQNLGASGRVDPQTAARIGKLVGARYVVTGSFIDFYGDFRVDARIVSVESGEIVKSVKEQAQRDHLFQIIQNTAARLMREANLPPLPRGVEEQRSSRQIPTEALTYYSRALLFQDRGQTERAVEMYQKALDVFPEYAEAREGLQRIRRS